MFNVIQKLYLCFNLEIIRVVQSALNHTLSNNEILILEWLDDHQMNLA